METTKVKQLDADFIEFENGIKLMSEHIQDCCEGHFLSFADLTMSDFDGLEFDLSKDDFFKRIEGYGIELVPITGHSIKIPGYGYNNGYYNDGLSLVLYNDGKKVKEYNITECQLQS